MLQAITHSILQGFALYSLIAFIAGFFFSEKTKEKADRLDVSATQIGALAGFIYLALTALDLLSLGRYSIPIWIHLFMIASMQLLWSEKMRRNKWVRLFIAVLLLFSLEGWFILIASVHRDYLPSSWSIPFLAQLQMALTGLGIFALITTSFHWIKSYFRPK